MRTNTLKTAIYALVLTVIYPTFASSKDIVCNGPDLSSVVYEYQGETKLIFKRGNSLPVSARCKRIETGELACREGVSGETLYFKFNEESREARIDIGSIKIYGLKCPLPQKKDAAQSL